MRRTPTLAFLLVTVFIDILGLGLVVPIAPSLLTMITGDAASGARWSGVVGSSYGVTQFLVAPLLGRLSDRYGRRPVLVLALGFLGIDYLVHGLANSVWLLVLAHGLAGAFAGTGIVINAYIADITEPAARPKAFGHIGAAFSIGFVAGPTIGGLLGGISLRLPFYAAATLAFANVLYGLLIVPESRAGDRMTQLGWRLSNPVSSLAMMLRRPVLRYLVIARLLSDIARMANQVCWVFVMVARFGWSTARVGVVLAVSSIIGAVVAARLSGPFVTRIGVRRAPIVCSATAAISLVGFAVLPGWLIIAAMALGSIAAIGAGAQQTWITGLAGDNEQGTVQGALTSISSIAEAAVPIAATAVFAWSLAAALPGLVLVLAAGFAVVSAILMAAATQENSVDLVD
jgi:MFS transporter, DHA1 family, tetracycline resistance protein